MSNETANTQDILYINTAQSLKKYTYHIINTYSFSLPTDITTCLPIIYVSMYERLDADFCTSMWEGSKLCKFVNASSCNKIKIIKECIQLKDLSMLHSCFTQSDLTDLKHNKYSVSNKYISMNIHKLDQLEHQCSETTPTAQWLHILLIHIRFQVKTRPSQSYKFQNFAKISKICKKFKFCNNFACDTPSEVAW